ncbi:unnamed protein product [Caenorhabditis auriculariae]|uniref:Uncharacterized protein n=1 Tax=Caenorhabditis auriculariae TaxID=2777116 RepID=A0A8S1GTJ1_9PELO|nr:unnamed protein product [Caenorhabditis auriculariae]
MLSRILFLLFLLHSVAQILIVHQTTWKIFEKTSQLDYLHDEIVFKGVKNPFVSTDFFIQLGTITIKDPHEGYIVTHKTNAGSFDVISLPPEFLFKVEAFQKINKNPYFLITHGSPRSSPGGYLSLINDPLLLHWFAVDVDKVHPKLSGIPVGLPRAIENTQQIASRQALKQMKKFTERPIDLYLNYILDSHDERTQLLNSSINEIYTGEKVLVVNSFEEVTQDFLLEAEKTFSQKSFVVVSAHETGRWGVPGLPPAPEGHTFICYAVPSPPREQPSYPYKPTWRAPPSEDHRPPVQFETFSDQ